MIFVKDLGLNIVLMESDIKEIGKKADLKDTENYLIPMEPYIKVNLKKVK